VITRLSPRHFGLLCLLGYVALSWAARFDMRLGAQTASLVYPLDTFSMYARMPGEDRSVLLVRDTNGTIHRVTEFQAFDCAEPLSGPAARCADKRGIAYHYEELAHYVDAHIGRGGEQEIELITRTWNFRRGAPPETSDCVITRCKVAR
jgi:hypothetical protein